MSLDELSCSYIFFACYCSHSELLIGYGWDLPAFASTSLISSSLSLNSYLLSSFLFLSNLTEFIIDYVVSLPDPFNLRLLFANCWLALSIAIFPGLIYKLLSYWVVGCSRIAFCHPELFATSYSTLDSISCELFKLS